MIRSLKLTTLGSSAVLALAAFTGVGCSVSTIENGIQFKTVPEYVDSKQPAKTSTKAWMGEEIEIKNNGVNPLTGTGGIQITVDPAATNISVSAIFAGRADTEAEAQQSIADAIATLQIVEEASKFIISCGNGATHGTSKAASSGCKLLKVTIPSGSATTPLTLKVGSGSGDVSFSAPVVVSDLVVDNNGLGTTDVKATPVKGARIIVTGEDAVSVALPSDFAADQVVLNVEPGAGDTDEQTAARIVTTDFPGMASGKAYGTAGTGAAELNVQTKGVFDDDTVTIKRQ